MGRLRTGLMYQADVTFYDTATGAPVLYLDTLKVSTIEETASEASANGGRGNAALIKWDFGKEITLTLEDALFSMKSLAMMHGARINRGTSVKRSKKFTATATTAPTGYPAGTKFYDQVGQETTGENESLFVVGDTYIAAWTETVTGGTEVITINAESFPGTYRIVGDTYARSYKTGKDEFFQFTIPMAKMSSENTITMQAEGKLWGLLSLNSTNCWKLLRAC